MSFGSNLENLRKQKGWSQDKLADKLHISRQAISKWENGTSKPDIDNVKSISNIFSIGIDELLDNELPDRAAKLDVEKEEKKENVIQVIKYMIIAVVLIYLISVIGKFISLLTIVNGIQKYANLDNYHYVITTYEDNEFIQREEYWFKNGISKEVVTTFNDNLQKVEEQLIYIDYSNEYGFVKENEKLNVIDVKQYLLTHYDYEKGSQLYSIIPANIRNQEWINMFIEVINSSILINEKDYMTIKFENEILQLKKDNLLPQFFYSSSESLDKRSLKVFEIELNNIENIEL